MDWYGFVVVDVVFGVFVLDANGVKADEKRTQQLQHQQHNTIIIINKTINVT